MELLAKQLAAAMPTLRATRVWLQMLDDAMKRFELDSATCGATFLAQIAHESDECRNLEDDLSYPAEALTRMWPDHFPILESARAYERSPERLANLVYANRMGNGPPESCDGYRYRGRGLLRIVGRANYSAAGAALGIDLTRQPESMLEPRIAALSAAWLWKKYGLNERRNAREIVGFRPAVAALECLKAERSQEPQNISHTPLFGAAMGANFPSVER
jgi:putative chitinase